MAAQGKYKEAHKAVRKSTREDKKRFIEGLAQEAEGAAAKGDMKQLYNTSKKPNGKYQQLEGPIKNKEGNIRTNSDDQLKRWAQHFQELLIRPALPQRPNIPAAETDLEISCDRPSRGVIKRAIGLLKTGKAAGPDGIPAEAIKADIDTSTDLLFSLLGKIWQEEVVPDDWKMGHLVKLPKKGDRRDCGNYRGIMLLSVPGKVLSRGILERLRTAVDDKLRDNQAGFRREKSCTGQIATLRIIVEQSIE